MTELFISLTVIAVISAVVPVIAHLIPHKVIPEAVLLIAAGVLVAAGALTVFLMPLLASISHRVVDETVHEKETSYEE